MKNPFKKIQENVKKRWELTRTDPYVNLKMNYNAVKYMVIFICGLIVINIITAIINMGQKASAMSLLARAAMVLVGFFIVQKMYFGVLNPLKKSLEHYEAAPTTQTSRYIDVKSEIDDIFDTFDKKEKLKKQLRQQIKENTDGSK
jgi:hypothetical protein